MRYVITETDKLLIEQSDIRSKVRISVLSQDKKILGVLTGVAEIGSFDVDAESDIRRVSSLNIKLDDFFEDIESLIGSYLALDFMFEIGIYYERISDFVYYKMGTLCITTADTSYDAVTNILSLNLSDWFSKLDGTRNGQVGGAPTITIPVEYEEGKKNTLRSAMIGIITSETSIEDYIIDDIGEYYGMPQNNEDYLEYRELNPDWNTIPYDLEFNAGDTVADLLVEIRDLYPNCQLYFDIYGNLCFDMIPSNNKAPVILNNDYLQSIILSDGSEDVQYDLSTIKNVVEVFGQTYDVDRYCEDASFNDDTYNLTLENFDSYLSYEMIAFKAAEKNVNESYINVNGLGKLPLYKEYTTTFISADTIAVNDVVTVKVMLGTEGTYFAYYLGQYQPHALCVLTEDINDPVYTKSYFSKRYNCLEKNIAFVEAKNSSFSIQKLGEILDSKTGEEYDNILSDSIALDNAKYLIYKSSIWSDIVTITIKLCPWLDVNTKVEYKKQQENDVYTYITKKISHDLGGGTTTVTMYRFSSLYQELYQE